MRPQPSNLDAAVRDAKAFIALGKPLDEARSLLERDFGPAVAAKALKLTASERRISAGGEGALGLLIGGALIAAGVGLLYAYGAFYGHGYHRGSGRTLTLGVMLIGAGITFLGRIFLKRS